MKESLEWFTELIAETKREMEDRFEVQVYLSSVSALGDVTAGMTHLGLQAYYERHKTDAITGLDTLTNYDRPQWHDVFSRLAVCSRFHVFTHVFTFTLPVFLFFPG